LILSALVLSLVALETPATETNAADVADANRVVGPPAGPPLAGAALDSETQRVALLLRCPVCQGLSVAESPSTMALNMRAQVRQLLASGFVEEQVLRYFERSYGEFVRLRPPLRGVNWIVWLAPIVGLLLGAAIVSRLLRRRRAPEAPGEPAPGADTDLEPYLRRVREAAYGWPGGVRPGKPAA
jgi:cytochrome c-type biogenesis protein CcmH